MTITTMKKLFASGLLLQITAQVLFSVHSDKINLMEPIDFIHWMILIGTVLIAPYVLVFSNGFFRSIGSATTVIGIVSNIGMCAIDFVLWTFRNNLDERNALAWHLMDEPMIWPIFFSVGPAFIFVGLAIQALGYVRENRVAVFIAVIGSIMVGLGGLVFPDLRIIFLLGYFMFAAGLLMLAFDKRLSVATITKAN